MQIKVPGNDTEYTLRFNAIGVMTIDIEGQIFEIPSDLRISAIETDEENEACISGGALYYKHGSIAGEMISVFSAGGSFRFRDSNPFETLAGAVTFSSWLDARKAEIAEKKRAEEAAQQVVEEDEKQEAAAAAEAYQDQEGARLGFNPDETHGVADQLFRQDEDVLTQGELLRPHQQAQLEHDREERELAVAAQRSLDEEKERLEQDQRNFEAAIAASQADANLKVTVSKSGVYIFEELGSTEGRRTNATRTTDASQQDRQISPRKSVEEKPESPITPEPAKTQPAKESEKTIKQQYEEAYYPKFPKLLRWLQPVVKFFKDLFYQNKDRKDQLKALHCVEGVYRDGPDLFDERRTNFAKILLLVKRDIERKQSKRTCKNSSLYNLVTNKLDSFDDSLEGEKDKPYGSNFSCDKAFFTRFNERNSNKWLAKMQQESESQSNSMP